MSKRASLSNQSNSANVESDSRYVEVFERVMKEILRDDASGYRTALYQKIEVDFGLWKIPAGDVMALQAVYQSTFDYLVDSFRGDYYELMMSKISGREKYEEHKELKHWIKEAAARVLMSIYDSQISVIQKLSRLIMGSLDMENYRDMKESYQVLSLMWLDLTSDSSGKLDEEVLNPAAHMVKQMYLLPWLDESKDATEVEDPDSASKTLKYLRLACQIAAEINYRRGRSASVRLDTAVSDYYDECFPNKVEVEAHVGKLQKALAKLADKNAQECKHGKVKVISSQAA